MMTRMVMIGVIMVSGGGGGGDGSMVAVVAGWGEADGGGEQLV